MYDIYVEARYWEHSGDCWESRKTIPVENAYNEAEAVEMAKEEMRQEIECAIGGHSVQILCAFSI